MKVHPINTVVTYCTHWFPTASQPGLPETDIILPQRSNLRD
jgi:hypothetical protein